MDSDDRLREVLASNTQLRGALILAGKEIRRLNFGKKDNKVLVVLGWMLRESRAVTKEPSTRTD